MRDEYLFVVSQEAWTYKPLSLGGLVRLLEMLGPILGGGYKEAMREVTAEMIAEIAAYLTWQPLEIVEEEWDFPSALRAAIAFWRSPEFDYLSSPPADDELKEPEERTAWITSIIERLSRGRGWTSDYILGLPFLGVLKLLDSLDEREWNQKNDAIMGIERGVGRAIAGALGKGGNLPDLPSYRDMKRRNKEAEQIKKRGRRFFEAARGE